MLLRLVWDSITKEVTIALISSDTKVVIVENTIAQESINTVGIFKLGRSSKGRRTWYRFVHCSRDFREVS